MPPARKVAIRAGMEGGGTRWRVPPPELLAAMTVIADARAVAAAAPAVAAAPPADPFLLSSEVGGVVGSLVRGARGKILLGRQACGPASTRKRGRLVELAGGEPYPDAFVERWHEGVMTDTSVKVGGRVFRAHKSVLSAASDFFKEHFANGGTIHLSDEDDPRLLEHVDRAAFEQLLTFLYEGMCSFDESLLEAVMRAAAFLRCLSLLLAALKAVERDFAHVSAAPLARAKQAEADMLAM